jgi:hypothetical protein
MKTRRHISGIALTTALAAAFALPASAPAEYYVPPSNSAANQYTESFPGAGGESGGKRKGATPGDTLGARNAKRLEEQGAAGKAAAEVAAETAPPQLVSGSGGNGGGGDTGDGAGGGDTTAGGGSGAPSGSGGNSSSGSGAGNGDQGTKVEQPQGSSGLGHVLGQATGVGDGDLGLWLPLAILVMLAGSLAYAARLRQARHGHSA